MGEGCYRELASFLLDRATNVNKDVPLARACRDDVKKHCSKKKYDRDNAADVLDCLRRLPKKKVGAIWRRAVLTPCCREHPGSSEHWAARRPCSAARLGSKQDQDRARCSDRARRLGPPLPPASSCLTGAPGACLMRRWRRPRTGASTRGCTASAPRTRPSCVAMPTRGRRGR